MLEDAVGISRRDNSDYHNCHDVSKLLIADINRGLTLNAVSAPSVITILVITTLVKS